MGPPRVYYIRHGESGWNHEQRELRKELPEAEVRARGSDAKYTDSPLSLEGVRQALKLRGHLFPEGADGVWAIYERLLGQPTALARLLRCAKAGTCSPPRLLVSNLRRAIDTLLLSMRPALEAPTFEELGVVVLPALQETCSHADCSPTARYQNGTIIEPLPFPDAAQSLQHMMAAVDASGREVAASVLRQQAERLEPAQGDVMYLRSMYSRHLALRSDVTFDDRRRVPAGLLTNWPTTPSAEQLAALAPFLQRVEDILSATLSAASKGNDVVITAHSRLLREILFVFRSQQRVEMGRTEMGADGAEQEEMGSWPTLLRWDTSNSAACYDLSWEDWKLSNTGAVAFELETCLPPACHMRTITLHGCRLDAGGFVYPRNGGAPTHIHDAASPPLASMVGAIGSIIVILPLASLCLLLCLWCHRRRDPSPAPARTKKLNG
jgi:hypothetical protein